MDLASIFKLLYRKKWYLLGIPFATVVIALLLTSDYRQLYKSTAQLSTGYTISQEVDPSESRFNIYETDIKFGNLIETINSSRVISLISYRLILHDLVKDKSSPFTELNLEKDKDRALYQQMDIPKLIQIYEDKLDSMQILNTYKEEEKLAQHLLEFYGYDQESLKEALTVRRVSNTDYVSVVAFTENPLLSAYIVNTLCEEFMRFNSSISSTRTSNAINVYSRLLEEKRKELDRASDALQRYKSSARTVNLEMERESQLSRVSELQLELQRERKNVNATTLQIQDIDRRLSSGSASPVTNADIIAIRNKINSLNERYRATGSSNPVLRDSLQVLRETQQRYIRIYSQESSNSRDNLLEEKAKLEVDLQIANQNIADLENLISSASSNAGGFASKEARISQLERELDLASEDYKEAQEKYNLALNASITSSNSINQILLGLPASKPQPSKRLIVSGIAGASTFIVIILIFLLLEYVDISIKSPSNFNDQVDMNLIGTLCHVKLKDGGLAALLGEGGAKEDTEVELFRDQLRKIRYNIMQSRAKVLLISSTKSGEGKSLFTKAMSIVLSRGNTRVLIIDTNFHDNYLTQQFEAPEVLEDYIREDVDLEKIPVKKNIFQNVDLLGCKGGDYTPIEIMDSNVFKLFIYKLDKEYDYILMEGAGLNENADSRELASFVDGVVTIFSAKSVIRQPDYESIAFLNSLGGKNIGAVLNDVELKDLES